jgi:hypothetical protein
MTPNFNNTIKTINNKTKNANFAIALFEFRKSVLAFIMFLEEKSLSVLLILAFVSATVDCALAAIFETLAVIASLDGNDATAFDNVFFADSAN